MTSSKLIAPEEGGLKPVNIRGMTKAERDWLESRVRRFERFRQAPDLSAKDDRYQVSMLGL